LPPFGKSAGYTPATEMRSIKPSFTLRRLQNILSVTLSIAAGVVGFGLILSSHAITGTGSPSGEDDASGWVDNSAVCPIVRPTPCPGRCSQLVVLAQNFDNVVPPILPPDWLATNALGPPPLWVTSNSGLPMPPAATAPNAAFVDDPGVVSDKRLDSLHFPVSGSGVQLTFEHNFNLEASDADPNVGFDGGVLEMSFDGGNTFQDILDVGGSFSIGGYNRTISTDRGSPIAGRQAWSGNSGGFICTVVTLPFLPPGGRFRWRMVSDNSGSGEGWRVDTVTISSCVPRPGCFPTPHPRPTPAPRP
jgi:hypothetical protein